MKKKEYIQPEVIATPCLEDIIMAQFSKGRLTLIDLKEEEDPNEYDEDGNLIDDSGW